MSAPLFTGALRRFGQGLVGADDSRPVSPLPALLEAERLDALLLGLYGPELMPSRLPVLVSQWAKYYFMQVIPPVVVASLACDWHWPLNPERIALALDERGVPIGLKWLGEGERIRVRPGNPFERFASLLDDNLSPVIDALSTYGDLPGAVLWSSAGDVLESCLVQCAELPDLLLGEASALLTSRTRPDGRRNPLFKTIRYVAQGDGSPPRRQRRACCLSYQVEWVGRCEHCPLPG